MYNFIMYVLTTTTNNYNVSDNNRISYSVLEIVCLIFTLDVLI